jgi:hypothetical protein
VRKRARARAAGADFTAGGLGTVNATNSTLNLNGNFRTAGLAGDLITALTGKPFYITSSRYRSMVTDYITPMDKTYTVLGSPKISLQQGVNETLTWLRTQPGFVHVPPVSKV